MKKKALIHPVFKQMLDDKACIQKQLQAGGSLNDIGVKIVSPIAISAEPA